MEEQNICEPLPERVTSPHAMDTTPNKNSALGVGEDDELTTPEDDSYYDSSLQLAPLPDPPIPFSLAKVLEEDAELREIFAALKEEREDKLKKELFHTVISRDELRKQLSTLFDCILDNLLQLPSLYIIRKELVCRMIAQFAVEGGLDQQLSWRLEQATEDWIKGKEKMSSTSDLIKVTSPCAMDTTPNENSVFWVGEDDGISKTVMDNGSKNESSTSKSKNIEDHKKNSTVKVKDTYIDFFGELQEVDPHMELKTIAESLLEYRKCKLLELLGPDFFSKDELWKQVYAQLPKLCDAVLDNILEQNSVMSTKELMNIIVSQFLEQGEFDQKLSLMLTQATADWIKVKEKMSSAATNFIDPQFIPSMKAIAKPNLTGCSSSEAE